MRIDNVQITCEYALICDMLAFVRVGATSGRPLLRICKNTGITHQRSPASGAAVPDGGSDGHRRRISSARSVLQDCRRRPHARGKPRAPTRGVKSVRFRISRPTRGMKSVRFRISRSTWARCRCRPRKVGAESCTRASLYGTRPTIQRASHRYGTHPAVQYAPCRYGMHPTATVRALPCGIALRYTPIPTLRTYGSADKYSRSRHFDRVIAGKLSRRCAVFRSQDHRLSRWLALPL